MDRHGGAAFEVIGVDHRRRQVRRRHLQRTGADGVVGVGQLGRAAERIGLQEEITRAWLLRHGKRAGNLGGRPHRDRCRPDVREPGLIAGTELVVVGPDDRPGPAGRHGREAGVGERSGDHEQFARHNRVGRHRRRDPLEVRTVLVGHENPGLAGIELGSGRREGHLLGAVHLAVVERAEGHVDRAGSYRNLDGRRHHGLGCVGHGQRHVEGHLRRGIAGHREDARLGHPLRHDAGLDGQRQGRSVVVGQHEHRLRVAHGLRLGQTSAGREGHRRTERDGAGAIVEGVVDHPDVERLLQQACSELEGGREIDLVRLGRRQLHRQGEVGEIGPAGEGGVHRARSRPLRHRIEGQRERQIRHILVLDVHRGRGIRQAARSRQDRIVRIQLGQSVLDRRHLSRCRRRARRDDHRHRSGQLLRGAPVEVNRHVLGRHEVGRDGEARALPLHEGVGFKRNRQAGQLVLLDVEDQLRIRVARRRSQDGGSPIPDEQRVVHRLHEDRAGRGGRGEIDRARHLQPRIIGGQRHLERRGHRPVAVERHRPGRALRQRIEVAGPGEGRLHRPRRLFDRRVVVVLSEVFVDPGSRRHRDLEAARASEAHRIRQGHRRRQLGGPTGCEAFRADLLAHLDPEGTDAVEDADRFGPSARPFGVSGVGQRVRDHHRLTGRVFRLGRRDRGHRRVGRQTVTGRLSAPDHREHLPGLGGSGRLHRAGERPLHGP